MESQPLNQTLLLVDDDENFRNQQVEYFENLGYNILTASNGEDGWEQVKNNKINLILLDVVMPGKNGSWLVETVRDSDEFKNTPIIIFTNLSHGENVGKILIKGISRMLVKENTSQIELAQTIREVLISS